MKDFFKIYKRYNYYANQKSFLHIISVLFGFFLLVAQNVVLFQIGRAVDNVSNGSGNLLHEILIIAAILASPILFEFLTFYTKGKVFVHALNESFKDIFKNMINLDVGFHLDKSTGKLISKVINTYQLARLFSWEVEWFLLESVAGYVIPIILLYLISPLIAASTLVSLVITAPLFIWILKQNVEARREVKDSDYHRNSIIADTLGNFETVRSFGSEALEQTNFTNVMKVNMDKQWEYQRTFRLSDFVVRIATLLIFLMGSIPTWYLFENGEITIGSIVIVLGYLITISAQLYNLYFRIRALINEMPILVDVLELMDMESTITESENPVELTKPIGEIEMRDVTFSYNGKNKILNNLTLSVSPQQTVALVGPSGGGKSTIIRTLMRYYDVDDGEVLLDGINVKELSFESLRGLFGLVPQEPVLFNKSIAYNIGYALNLVDGINEEEMEVIVDAAKKAQIHKFIDSLPDKYDTIVGERGLKLSGGQKQRVAIARVLIKDPKIVIFDEATSMLDSESEIAIQKAFAELSKDKTTIIIAHRLSTITHSDKIFVVDNGKITEVGTHQELLKQGGTYKHLWDIQSGGFKKGLAK